jgi:hypothetical protein
MANEYDLSMVARLADLKYLGQRTDKRLDALEEKAASIPTKVSDLTNDSKYQTKDEVTSAVKAAVAGALQPAGSVAFASLPALNADNLNKIVNVTDKFTTTADFVEGEGKKYPAGTNVAIINVGTSEAPEYKYDAYTGVIDTSGFATLVDGGTKDDIAVLDANGNIADGGKKLSDFVEKETGKGLSTNDFTDELKNKLDGVTSGATKTEASETNGNVKINGTETTVYTHDTHTEYTSGLYKVTVDGKGHVTAAEAVAKADITGLGIPGQDTTYSAATTSADGLMSSSDKSKLDGITFCTDEAVKAMLDDIYGAETTEG